MKAPFEFQTYEQYTTYLRTYFAAMAMQGLVDSSPTVEKLCELSIRIADELLKQLES